MKKFLIILGVVLFALAGVYGAYKFIQHRNYDQDVKKAEEAAMQTAQKPSFDKTTHSITDPNSIWVVVNKKHPLNPISYAPADLTPVGNDQQMRTEAATGLATLMTAAKNVGLNISPLSAYRSYDTQVGVYNNEVKNYGQATADSESARPGYSEHQTGLAVDVGGGGCGIEDCFGNTAEGKWLADNAYLFGYIVRYTTANQAVTGYRAEPWHIRYIGKDLALEMHKQGITTLEEFFGISGGDYAN